MKKTIVRILAFAVLPAVIAAVPPSAGYFTERGVNTVTGSGISIAVTGDILLDRGVGKAISAYGMEYPYDNIRDILSRADFAFGNLECPLTGRTAGIIKNSRLIFKGDPQNAQILKQAGFDVLNIANNHSMDYGSGGLTDTIKALSDAGIMAAGGGAVSTEAARPVFLEKSGMTVGFLGFSAFPAEGYFFSDDKPDVAHADSGKMADTIRNARSKCDFLIVSFHWGREFDFYPDKEQKAMARSAIDSGADLVIGHHPHVLQGIDEYKGKLIFYSLGNFVFDRQIQKGTDETVILKMNIAGGYLDRAEIIPVKISNCQPAAAGGAEAGYILDRLKLYSEGMNAEIVKEGGRAYVRP